MQGLAFVFYALTAITLFLAYLSIRREWFSPGITATVTVILSIILMILTSLGEGNAIIHAVVVGILIGSVFSAATLGIAWYFHNQERQQRDQS
jgi:ABC-type Fe3+-siderophore transport system permease subunit